MLKEQLGPLYHLVGQSGVQTWKGKKGVDLAPDPDGIEKNLYEDQITFESIGELENAEEQVLMALRYHQQVHRIKDNKLIHDQTGYWIWEKGTDSIIHSFSIPRGLSTVATGNISKQSDAVQFKVSSNLKDQGIVQIAFLAKKAITHSFDQTMLVQDNVLKYEQIMQIEIYDRMIEHKDVSELSPVIREEFEL